MALDVGVPVSRQLGTAGTATSGRLFRVVLIGMPLAAIGLLVFYPMIFVVFEAFTGTSNLYPDATGTGAVFVQVLASHEFHLALMNTLVIAVISTLGCLVLGFVLGLIVAFVPFPGSALLSRMIDAYLSFPSFLIALSFTFLYGFNGMVNEGLMHVFGLSSPPLGDFVNTRWAVILGEVTFYTPFVIRPILAAFSQLDTAVIEAASNLGAHSLRIIRQVILPEAVPALLAGGSLTLVLTLNEFGIVAIIGAKGVRTLTMDIYSQAVVSNEATIASVMAVVSIVLSLAMYSAYRYFLSRSGGGANAGSL